MGRNRKGKSKPQEEEESSSQAEVAPRKLNFGPDKDPKWWDINTFSKDDNKNGLLEESRFSCIFPKYREKYIQECWPLMEQAMESHCLKADLDLLEGTMTVRTTRKTWDPYVIIKARDVLKLLSRSVPFDKAIKVLEDDVTCEIMKFTGMCYNKERFIKRRARLVGNEGATLKAIELLTNCYVCIQGGTVAAVGPFHGLKQVTSIVTDCMKKNVHPIYNIKTLMIRRELEKNDKLKNENWERFLPKFRKNIQSSETVSEVKKKKKGLWKKKGPYTPFPPPQKPRTEDILMETGEFFMTDLEKEKDRKAKMVEKMAEKTKERKQRLANTLIPKAEAPMEKVTKRKAEEKIDMKNLKKKAKKVSKV